MNNDKDKLKLYAEKVLELVNIVKVLFEKKIFENEGVDSIHLMRYISTGQDKNICLMIDFYDTDGLFMRKKEGFEEIEEIRKIPHIIYTLNTLKINKEPFFGEDVMLEIEPIKGCEQVVLESLLPKQIQIQIDYNDLKNEIVNNQAIKTNKVKI